MKKLLSLCLCGLCGCAALKDHVLVTTTSVLGLEVAENPSTGLYQARLGYVRNEFALMPTNNINVLTEVHWHGLFTTGGYYQRMAVGDKAVQAALPLFLKKPDGTVDVESLKALLPNH
jgi:hypothetical protein